MKYVPGTLELMEHPKCVAAPHYPKKKIIQTFISLRVLPFFPFLFKQQSAVFPITGYFQCVMNEWPLISGSKSRSLFVYPLRAHHSFSAVSESVLAIPVCQTHGKDGGGETSTNSYLLQVRLLSVGPGTRFIRDF